MDIHRLIFESDERIREMIRQTKREEEEEEGVQDYSEEEEDALERLSREQQTEFRCDHCGNRNLVVRRSSAGASPRPRQQSTTTTTRPDKPPRRKRRGHSPPPPLLSSSRPGLFRSKSRARFLNQAEQQKLHTFRRYLLGSGVGYHDLLSRVGEIRARHDRERAEAVDEDGLTNRRAKRDAGRR